MTDERDWAVEMRDVIDAHTSIGPYVPRQVASKVVAWLRENDPELLDGWLHAQAEPLLWRSINDLDRSRRAHSRTHAPRAEFSQALDAHEEGDSAPLAGFLGARFTVEDGTRRPLADLRGPDLSFVAGAYRDRERRNAFFAVFFEKLAAKVGDGTVADHFTEDQLQAMLRNVA